MAMLYYQECSEIQADGLQTLYLMNPNYVGYFSDNPTDMNLLNSASSNPTSVPLHNTHPQVASIPLSHDPNRPSSVIGHQQQIQGGPAHNTIPRFGYNLWAGSVDQESGNRNQPNIAQQTPQGLLSLSLSTNQTGFNKSVTTDEGSNLHKVWSSSPSVQSFVVSNNNNIGVNNDGMQSVVLGSKYVKAAQELLDEVANVGKSIKADQEESKDKASKVIQESDDDDNGNKTDVSSGGGELTTASQRQEIQMKKAKLISMLDEVEQRYRQYNVQMQIIVASFEQATGIGSAKSYTHLALKTISKQFRCLKDAISTQIKALSKSLGEEEERVVEGSKLKYVDNQLRQHRALQQLGMVQNNAWRPQRGLPERAVTVLRSWLFEHFLHPYPKDSDKQILAKQTGLTRSQVSNWFINARVRLWKPMVEEMYMEEMRKNNNQQTNTSDHDRQDNTTQVPKPEPNNSTNPNKVNLSPTHISTPISINPPGPNFSQLKITPFDIGNASKKPRNDTDQVEDSPNSMLSVETEMKAGYGTTSYNGFQELNRFDPGQLATAFNGNYNNTQNAVSLTLGLPSSGSSWGTHYHQQDFLNFGTTAQADQLVEHDDRVNNIGYEHMMLGNFQNRKPFPAQLLPDFVA